MNFDWFHATQVEESDNHALFFECKRRHFSIQNTTATRPRHKHSTGSTVLPLGLAQPKEQPRLLQQLSRFYLLPFPEKKIRRHYNLNAPRITQLSVSSVPNLLFVFMYAFDLNNQPTNQPTGSVVRVLCVSIHTAQTSLSVNAACGIWCRNVTLCQQPKERITQSLHTWRAYATT